MQPFFRRMHFGLSQRLIPHNSAHRRFDATLRQRQEDKSGNIDIRKHVISLQNKFVSLGFNDFELETYSHNLKRFLPWAMSNQNKNWANGDRFLVLG